MSVGIGDYASSRFAARFMKNVIMSIGSGNMIVEFFSAEIVFNV